MPHQSLPISIYGYGSKLGTPKLWMVKTKLDIHICGPINGLPFWPTSIWLWLKQQKNGSAMIRTFLEEAWFASTTCHFSCYINVVYHHYAILKKWYNTGIIWYNIESITKKRLPSGKRLPKTNWKDPPFYSWVNQLFRLGHFPVSYFDITRGYFLSMDQGYRSYHFI